MCEGEGSASTSAGPNRRFSHPLMGSSAQTMPTSERLPRWGVTTYFTSFSGLAHAHTASGRIPAPRSGTFPHAARLPGTRAPLPDGAPAAGLLDPYQRRPGCRPPPLSLGTAHAAGCHPRWPPSPPPAAAFAACCCKPLLLAPPSVAATVSSRGPRRWPPLPSPAANPAAGAGAGAAPAAGRLPRYPPPAPPLAASPAACRRLRRWRHHRPQSMEETTPARVGPAGGRAFGAEWRVAGVGVGGRRPSGVGGASWCWWLAVRAAGGGRDGRL